MGDEKNKDVQAAALSGPWRSDGSTGQPLQARFPLRPQGQAKAEPQEPCQSPEDPLSSLQPVGTVTCRSVAFSGPAGLPQTAWTGPVQSWFVKRILSPAVPRCCLQIARCHPPVRLIEWASLFPRSANQMKMILQHL